MLKKFKKHVYVNVSRAYHCFNAFSIKGNNPSSNMALLNSRQRNKAQIAWRLPKAVINKMDKACNEKWK